MKRRVLTILTVLLALIGVMAFAVACTEKPEPTPEVPVSGAEVGEYYCDVNGAEYLLTLSEGCKFTLKMGSDEKSGDYRLDGESLSLKTEGETISASYKNETTTVSYNDKTYAFIRKIAFTVKFESNGGGSISDVTVINGRKIAKPADPVKDGHIFVGWYTDSNFKNAFRFTEAVKGNMTLYARFVENIQGEREFTVNFDLNYEGGEGIAARKTTGGKLYNLPTPEREGYEFAGWWVSHYNDSEKLTYRYEEQTIEENLTLFAVWTNDSSAPIVSVDANGVSWEASGVNNNYVIKITPPNEEADERSVGTTYYSYDFSSKAAGEYVVEVSLRGNARKAYYNNKGLARVSLFEVRDSVLVWNAVANAEVYLVNVVCGTAEHDHKAVNVGNSTSFNFEDCDMREGGIVFTVTARANGFISSVSQEFVYERSLDKVTGLKVDDATEIASWDAVQHAVSYYVEVLLDGKQVFAGNVGSTLSYVLKTFESGQITVKVRPVARGYNAPEDAQVVYDKTRLAAPTNVHLQGSTIIWEIVDGAEGYKVRIGDKEYTVKTNSFELTAEDLVAGQSSYSITVCTLGKSDAQNSLYSDEVTIRNGEMGGNLTYESGTVIWDSVFGINTFIVKVNDGKEETVKNVNSFAVTLTKKGDNVISVCSVDADGKRSEWVSITVTAYVVAFDAQAREGEGIEVPHCYLAYRDKLVLPEVTRRGYEFGGWYTAPANKDGTPGGVKYDDTFFNEENDRTLYAYWVSLEYVVSFDVGIFGTASLDSEKVYFGRDFKLPVPESNDVMKVFAGWWTEPNAVGFKYTRYDGSSIDPWMDTRNRTLYAEWADVFEFTPVQNGTGYSVSKGTGIGFVKEITIPAKYNNQYVLTVENFASCTNLEVVNIPNTVTLISLATTAAAFKDCTALQEVNVYIADDTHEGRYESIDGALIDHDPESGSVKLAYFPQGRTGFFTIPDIVTFLPTAAFRLSKLSEIEIPASVIMMEKQAFYSCGSLVRVIFLPTPEGQNSHALTIREEAFYSCAKLTDITLPSRIESLDSKSLFSLSGLINVFIDGSNGIYSSVSGLLTKNIANGKELIFFPKGRSGEVVIPSGITSVGEAAFKGNTKITKVTIPFYVTNIGKEAFMNCSKVTELVFGGLGNDAPLTIGVQAFYNVGLSVVNLPENLANLAKNAFGSVGKSNNLITVNVESGRNNANAPLNFAANAFAYTSGSSYVTVVNLGRYVTAIDVGSVFGRELKQVNVDPRNENYSSDEEGVLFDKDKTMIVFFPFEKEGEYVVPETVEMIGGNTFNSRKGLTKITISKNVTEIGQQAFYACSNLQEVVFLSGTKPLTIGQQAFYQCALRNLDLPSRTREIGTNAFAQCKQLTSIVIPEGVKTIGAGAFGGCSNLVSISLPASLESLVPLYSSYENYYYYSTFSNSDDLREIIVAEGNTHYAAINNVLYGKTYDEVTGEYVVTDLLYCPVGNGGENGVVTVMNTVRTIWPQAFARNDYMTELRFDGDLADMHDPETGAAVPGKLTIGYQAFYYNDSLRKVVLPRGVVSFGKQVFYYCKALEEIFIPNTVESIGQGAFYYCESLVSLTFEKGNESTPLRFEDGSVDPDYETPSGVFYKCDSLTSITLPERTNYIGVAVFGLSKLKEIHLPASLETIADYAFSQSTLETVTFAKGSKLKKIGNSAFYYCSIKELDLPGQLETIGNYAFLPKTAETQLAGTLRIPATVNSIGNSAFWRTGMEELIFENNSRLESIGSSTFLNCANLRVIDFGKNSSLRILGNQVFKGCTALERVVLPKSLEELGKASTNKSIFEGDYSLTSVTFEEGVTNLKSIGETTFKGTGIKEFTVPASTSTISLGVRLFQTCKNLTTVRLSAQVASINNVFLGCGSIKRIIVDEENTNFKSDENGLPILYNLEGTTVSLVYAAIDSIVLSDETEMIGNGAFANQANMTSIVIPANVRSIGANAFQNCVHLKKVVIEPNSLLSEIGDYAFTGCWELESINIETASTLKSLGEYAFEYCTSLPSINLPDSLNALRRYTFDGCSSLETVKLPNALQYIGYYPSNPNSTTVSYGYVFRNCRKLKNITLPSTLISLHSNSFQNCESLTEIALPDSLTGSKTGTYIFEGCTALKSVKMPKGYDRLTSYFFHNCKSLTSFTIPETVTNIQTYCFAGTSIKSIVIPKAAKTLGTYLFKDCAELENVRFAEGTTVTALPNYMFANCPKLKTVGTEETDSVRIPTTFNHLGTYTFLDCTGLTRVDLSELTKVTQFHSAATGTASVSGAIHLFENCVNLSEVILPPNLLRIGGQSFMNCTSLKTINLSGVVLIAKEAFKNTGLQSIVLPKSIQASSGIGANAFEDCTSLSSVEFESGYIGTSLGNYAFQGCTALKTITLPDSLTYIGAYVFKASGLETIDLTNLTKVKYLAYSSSWSATSEAGTFMDCTNLSEVKLPSNITRIGPSVFANCTSLKSIDLSNMDMIAAVAFSGSGLESITLSEKLTTLGHGAFSGCPIKTINATNNGYYTDENGALLTKDGMLLLFPSDLEIEGGVLTLGDYVTGIGNGAFYGNQNIKEVIIPESCTSIRTSAFAFSTIERITIPATVKDLGKYVFEGSELKEVVLNSTNPYYYTNEYTTMSSYYKTSTYTFSGARKLSKVTLSNEHISLGDGMFEGCDSLTSFTIPASVTTVGKYVFIDSGLEELTLLGDSIVTNTNVSGYAFSGSANLKKVTLAEGVKVIGGRAFENCVSLESISLPSTLTTIGTYAFSGSGLKSIEIPDSVTATGTYLFANCTQLKTVKFSASMVKVEANTFNGCTALETVDFSDGINEISNNAFDGCTALKLFIPAGISYINYNAFNGLTEEQTLYVEATEFEATALWYAPTGIYTYGWRNGCNAKVLFEQTYDDYLKAIVD